MENEKKFYQTNQSLWNRRTPIHVDSEFYDLPQFLKGKSSLKSIELEALGHELAGKSLLHLQCHFGQDSLSWVRMGARVTGMDFSQAAIAKARELRDQLQLEARFICCNVYDLPKHLEEQFDLVFTSYGVLCWLHDLEAYAIIVEQMLQPGGIFYIVEFHPVLYMFDWEQNRMAHDYFHRREPLLEVSEHSYTDGDTPVRHKEYSWAHALSEVVTPLLNQGLRLLEFKEYDYAPYDCFPNMKHRAEGQYVYQGVEAALPHLFSLKMQKPD